MSWNSEKEAKRLCEEWLKDPLVNPKTGRPIERDGPIYKKWEEKCKKLGLSHRPVATKKMTWRKCQEFKKDPHTNPETGRKITPGSPTWRSIYKQCKNIEKEFNILGEYPKPESNGLVAVKKVNDHYYIIRSYEGRPVYGPLNKYAENSIFKVYFKDTWDYINDHYKPIFVNGREPPEPRQSLLTGTSKTDPKKRDPKKIVDSFFNVFMD